ncbi:MAG: hypothetical protein J5986_10970 [Roseburia sp.]|nr:hypothetical protein [Roseburia sp.]
MINVYCGYMIFFCSDDRLEMFELTIKHHILQLYEIPLLRFKTNGSGEKEKIIEALDKLAE